VWSVVRSVVHAVEFVYCQTLGPRPTFRNGEDPVHVRLVRARGRRLAERYDEVMLRMQREGARVITYDWTRQRPEEVLECLR
jgi:hypothetical protein